MRNFIFLVCLFIIGLLTSCQNDKVRNETDTYSSEELAKNLLLMAE